MAKKEEEKKVDSRIKVLENVPASLEGEQKEKIDCSEENLKKLAGGKVVSEPRAAFIRRMAETGFYTRSELTEMCRVFGDNPELKYQIIFQATKDLDVEWPAKPKKEKAEEEKEDA
jgi:hypothetical protein